MAKPINTLSSLIDTRRYIRSVQLSTEKYIKDLDKIKVTKSSRVRNDKNDKTRQRIEKGYIESQNNLRLVRHIQTTLKTHLYEKTRLNGKMLSQTDDLLLKNKQLLDKAEVLMMAYIASTKIDDDLTLIKRDLVKRLSKDFYVTEKTIMQGDKNFGVITIQSNSNTDILYCVVHCNQVKGMKTFLNELPVVVDDQNFIVFESPSQAYKQIQNIMKTDGFE
jgi:hypothetical protein